MKLNELDALRRRQLIDAQQLYEAYEHRRKLFHTRFDGSMRWVQREGAEYLLRKRGKSERSLGRRSPETEEAHRRFVEGREQTKEALASLAAKLDDMAPINVAMGLGRVPRITARILRKLTETSLLGEHLHVVGTNALFAYEAATGAFCAPDLLATADADLLLDSRRRLRLALADAKREGVLGLIRKVDRSFEPRGPFDYRAVNRDGFYVDLIRPEDHHVVASRTRNRIGEKEDLHGSPIHGLAWLVYAPKFTAVAIDEKGYPVRMDTVDPRAFALHKAWVASRPDREALKRLRDIEQAKAAATLAVRYLNLPFEETALSALPQELRNQAPILLSNASSKTDGGEDNDVITPNW